MNTHEVGLSWIWTICLPMSLLLLLHILVTINGSEQIDRGRNIYLVNELVVPGGETDSYDAVFAGISDKR